MFLCYKNPSQQRMTPMRGLLRPFRLGVDTGGTFTDFVLEAGGRLTRFKLPSIPRDPARAVAAGARRAGARLGELVHGTTVATNALLERRGARTALVTTRGFEDVIVIGRQARPALYDFDVRRPAPLVPDALRLGVRERTGPDGRVLESPRPSDLRRAGAVLRRRGAQSVAICFLHSYASGRNERRAARALRTAAPFVCTSAAVLPEHREFERFSTTVLSAYLTPVLGDYLRALERRVPADILRVLRSDGTTLSARSAAREAAHSLLSGPAAGVVACAELGRRLGLRRMLSLDMGGTSTDVCLQDGPLPLRRRWQVGGWPVALPSLAIDTVGAGGGSLARVDEGGALRVGPESAGADPGPICWGRGSRLTVTDAHLFLGRLDPAAFEAQGVRLFPPRVAPVVRRLARRLGVSAERAAEGVLRVVEAEMERALRRASVEQGHDPRRFTLVAFGGAGGLHAVALARRLGCRRVLIPPSPGTFSALGLLLSPPSVERSATVVGRAMSARRARRVLERLEAGARRTLAAERGRGPLRLERWADLRYRGQSHELSVPFGSRTLEEFHRLHRRRFGISDPGQPVEWVALRVRAWLPAARPRSLEASGSEAGTQRGGEDDWPAADTAPAAPGAAAEGPALPRWRPACWDGRWRRTLILPRTALRPERTVRGPALILEYGATTALPPGASARAGAEGVLWVTP